MSEADRLAAALKQEQWAHTETAKRGTSYMVAAFDAEQARRIRAEERVEVLEAICGRLHAAYVIEEDTNGFPFSFELRDAHRELQAALKGADPDVVPVRATPVDEEGSRPNPMPADPPPGFAVQEKGKDHG